MQSTLEKTYWGGEREMGLIRIGCGSKAFACTVCLPRLLIIIFAFVVVPNPNIKACAVLH